MNGSLSDALPAIRAERERQDAKWGEQNHRDGTGYDFERQRESLRKACQDAAAEGVVTWADIFLEEVYEALSETNPERLHAELIEAAAVAAQWADAIKRRQTVPQTAFEKLSEGDKAAWLAMTAEMKEAERLGPPYAECGCGYPVKACLRVVLRNGPPYPERPCERV